MKYFASATEIKFNGDIATQFVSVELEGNYN